MKSVKLTGIRRMALVEEPAPQLTADTDVLVKVERVGVCGSDVHYFTEGGIGTDRVSYPWTTGHEGAGTVEAVGAAVTRVKPGERIVIDPCMPCYACDQCLAGRWNTCRKMVFLGCPGQVEGCLAEYLRLPQTSCYPMPAAMSFDEAAAVEPLSIGLYASDQAGALEDATIGILGCGPIGMSVLLACRAKNAARLYVTDKIDARLAAASKAGASWTGNPTTTDVVASIVEREPLQLDIVFECCGEQEALDQGIEFLKPGGKLILIGIPAVNRVSFDINKLRRKELCIQNTRRQNDTVQRAIDLISTGSVNVNPMITHHFDLDRTQEAFDLVADYGDGIVKAMICLG